MGDSMGATLSETQRVTPGAGTGVAHSEPVDRHGLDGASTNSFQAEEVAPLGDAFERGLSRAAGRTHYRVKAGLASFRGDVRT
jgi:hypothetical protein